MEDGEPEAGPVCGSCRMFSLCQSFDPNPIKEDTPACRDYDWINSEPEVVKK